jgi:hypothetical protein
MIRIEKIKQNIILLYSILVVIVFLQSGGRTYFIYNCIPIFYYFIRKKNKGLSIVFFFVLFLGIIFSVKNFSNSEFYSRFFNIVNLQNDSSFMYRVENIFEMFKTFNIFNALFGNGIGSNYIVFLYGWKESFFLDNSFITLVYKVGILGSLIFCSVFCVNKNVFPKDVYVFEIISLLIISSVSYHVILNPVFVFGYFVLYSYFFEEWFSLSNGPLRHSLRIPYKRIVV